MLCPLVRRFHRLVLMGVCAGAAAVQASPAVQSPASFLVATDAAVAAVAAPMPGLGACRTWSGEAKFGPSEDSFPRVCSPIAAASAAERHALASALIARGASAAQARERVAALSDAQAAQLSQMLDSAPAGASALGGVVFASVAVLFSDVLGYTKVYPFVLRPGTPP